MQKVLIVAILSLAAVSAGILLSGAIKPDVVAETKQPELNPPSTALEHFARGEYFFNSGPEADGTYDRLQARFHYERAVELDPKVDPLAWYQLARINFLQGAYDAAIEQFTTQQEYFGDTIPNLYYMLGLTYGFRARDTGNEEDWRQAERAFTTYIEEHAYQDWAPRVDLAWVYFAQGKYEHMLWPTEEALEWHTENPWLLNMYGLALLNTDQPKKAHEVFLKTQAAVAKLTPEDWGAAYPGNDPRDYPAGLAAFQEAVDKNLALTASAASSTSTTQ